MELGHGGNLCVPTTSLQFQPANHVVLSVPATGGKELLGICAFPTRRLLFPSRLINMMDA
jgi:hypothetical protein